MSELTMIEKKSILTPLFRQPKKSSSLETTADPTGMGLSVRTAMEAFFGLDFSCVRIHKNSAQAVRLHALAYTSGDNVHFAPGQWSPDTIQGRKLIGHELAHVVQQRKGISGSAYQCDGLIVNNNTWLEREADSIGMKAAAVPIQQSQFKTRKIKSVEESGGRSGVLDGRIATNPGYGKFIQCALATIGEINKASPGKNYNWTSFKTVLIKIKDDHREADGRGVVVNGKEIKTKVNWSPKKYDDGTKMTASRLGPDHEMGTEVGNDASSAKRLLFDKISKDNKFNKRHVSGHLLNQKLGGTGTDSENLAIIPSDANSIHSAQVETCVKDLVNVHRRWVSYGVEVVHALVAGTVDTYYAQKLICNWAQLDKDGKEIPDTKSTIKITISSPASGVDSVAEKIKSVTELHDEGVETPVGLDDVVLTDTDEIGRIVNFMTSVSKFLDKIGISKEPSVEKFVFDNGFEFIVNPNVLLGKEKASTDGLTDSAGTKPEIMESAEWIKQKLKEDKEVVGQLNEALAGKKKEIQEAISVVFSETVANEWKTFIGWIADLVERFARAFDLQEIQSGLIVLGERFETMSPYSALEFDEELKKEYSVELAAVKGWNPEERLSKENVSNLFLGLDKKEAKESLLSKVKVSAKNKNGYGHKFRANLETYKMLARAAGVKDDEVLSSIDKSNAFMQMISALPAEEMNYEEYIRESYGSDAKRLKRAAEADWTSVFDFLTKKMKSA